MEELLSIGAMAEMNGVSVKALHVYQEKGLLSPSYVNDQTGYRYYTLDQCETLDTIVQLQGIGMTLSEIKQALDDPDPVRLRGKLTGKLADIVEQQRLLQSSRGIVEDLIRGCDLLIDPPLCGEIMLEVIPEHRVLRYEFDPYPLDSDDELAARRWEESLRSVKDQLVADGYPVSLFRRVFCGIEQASVSAGDLVMRLALIPVDPSYADVYSRAVVVPEQRCLTLYNEHSFDEDGASVEYHQLVRMLDYAKHKGFSIAGDYYGEALVDTPAFGYSKRDSFFRMCLPVVRGTHGRGGATTVIAP